MDTWAATEAVIQGVERKLHAWFQGVQGPRRGVEGAFPFNWNLVQEIHLFPFFHTDLVVVVIYRHDFITAKDLHGFKRQ